MSAAPADRLSGVAAQSRRPRGRRARSRGRCGFAALAMVACCAGSAASAGQARAPLLHAMFQDHVVLQRDRPIRVWGTSQPDAEVTVRLAGTRATASADAAGGWEVELPPLPAGGPHVLVVTSGDARQAIEDILVGDVWLCSGQSNMELPVWRSLDARAEIEGAHAPTIRLFTVPQHGAAAPMDTFAGPVHWQTVTPDTVRDFSAACFYFARELQKSVDVPMGLVSAAWGGSRIQAWTSAAGLRAAGRHHDGALDILATHANDPVSAAARWGASWQHWWLTRDEAERDAPWSLGAGSDRQWHDAPRELGPWERWGAPELAAFDGLVWYRTTVRLTQAQARQDARLLLGPVDETDMSFVNGRGVGSAYAPGTGRDYPLPRGLLREGDNVVAVAVLDTYRDGGMSGSPEDHALRFADGSRVPLANWRYRVVHGDARPPGAPWQTAGGLTTLYNGMIAPLGRLGLHGILWYQGESNIGDGRDYADRLRTLRGDWRARFGADRPWLVAQLAAHGTPASQPQESGWAELREAQRQVAGEDSGTGLAVTIDIGDRYDVHPPNKQELGRRLARVARHVVYGEALPPSGPVPNAARRDGDTVTLSFGDIGGELVAYGAEGPIGFELCDVQRGSCRYARAGIDGDRVILQAPSAGDLARVRYCWADYPVCTLFDTTGLPAGPFELPIQRRKPDEPMTTSRHNSSQPGAAAD
jgi:sialate O-acetylesterase